jgi:hypothetical protein
MGCLELELIYDAGGFKNFVFSFEFGETNESHVQSSCLKWTYN